MDNKAAPQKVGVGSDKVEVNIERYGQLLEVDLWSKFQSRLWAIGGAILTIVALLSLFGIPIIVDTKINSVFSERTKKFDETIDHYLALYRTYFIVNSLVTQYRYRLNWDTLTAISFLESKYRKPDATEQSEKERANRVGEIIGSLRQIASEPQSKKILASHFLLQGFRMGGLVKDDLEIPLEEVIWMETTSFTGAAGSTFGHPLRTKKLSSLLVDIQLRLILLASFEQALEGLKQTVLSLGGGSAFDKKAKILQVESQMQTQVIPRIISAMNANFNDYSMVITSDKKHMFADATFLQLLRHYMKEAGFSLDDSKVSITPKTTVVDAPAKADEPAKKDAKK